MLAKFPFDDDQFPPTPDHAKRKTRFWFCDDNATTKTPYIGWNAFATSWDVICYTRVCDGKGLNAKITRFAVKYDRNMGMRELNRDSDTLAFRAACSFYAYRTDASMKEICRMVGKKFDLMDMIGGNFSDSDSNGSSQHSLVEFEPEAEQTTTSADQESEEKSDDLNFDEFEIDDELEKFLADDPTAQIRPRPN